MSGQIMPISEIVDSAHQAAEAGQSVAVCPFPDGSAPADRWRVAFYAREKEIRAEVEQ